ncbi:MAG: APC family permease [Asgard group archaeon]|nr:APC family permease [Asgard group archaeon]
MEKENDIGIVLIIAIGLTTTLGSGIWFDPIGWVNTSNIMSLITLFITWLLFLCAGLAYAECISMFPKAGGNYSYVKGAFGKKIGRITGYLFLIGYCIAGAIITYFSVNYTLAAFNIAATIGNKILLAFIYILIFAIILGYSSSKHFGYIILSWVGIKLLTIIIVITIGFTKWESSILSSFENYEELQTTINLTIWSMLGVESMLVFSGKTKKTEKKLPMGLLLVILIVFVVYVLFTTMLAGIIPKNSIDSSLSKNAILTLFASFLGVSPKILFIFSAFSSAGTAFSMFGVSIFQMKFLTEDNALPNIFEKELKNFKIYSTPIFLGISTLITLILILTEQYSMVFPNFATLSVALILLAVLLPAGLIGIYLRIKFPTLHRPFKSPLYFIVFPLAFILCLYMLVINFLPIGLLWPGVVSLGLITLTLFLAVFLFSKDQKKIKEK